MKYSTPYQSQTVSNTRLLSYSLQENGGYYYGFNGQERDDEVYAKANAYDYGARILDVRLGKWFSIDPRSHDYPSHSPYSFGLDNPIFFVDQGGEYIRDKDGKIVKFRIKKDGTVKFRGSVDPFTRKVIESMAKLPGSRTALLVIKDDKEIIVQYQKMTDHQANYFKEEQNMIVKGVTISRDEYHLLVQLEKGQLTKAEFEKKRAALNKEQYTQMDGKYQGQRVYEKTFEIFKEQVILVNEELINQANDPDKEFLLTVTEESLHTHQPLIQFPPKGGIQSQQQYEDLLHEKEIKPILDQLEKAYDNSIKQTQQKTKKE